MHWSVLAGGGLAGTGQLREEARQDSRSCQSPGPTEVSVPSQSHTMVPQRRDLCQPQHGSVSASAPCCMCVLVIQSCLTLCDHMDCSPPGSSAHAILRARVLEWAMPFSRGSSQPRDQTPVSSNAGGFFTTEPLVKLLLQLGSPR